MSTQTKRPLIWIVALLAMVTMVGGYLKVRLMQPPSDIEALSDIDIEKVNGPWFEIARMDNALERGASPNLLLYLSKEPEFKLILSPLKDEKKLYAIWETTARYSVDPTTGSIDLPCLGLFRCGFHIIALDRKDHVWMLVTGPTRGQLWLFARAPGIEWEQFDRIKQQAEDWGYDTAAWVINNHPMVLPSILPKVPEAMPPSPSETPRRPDPVAPPVPMPPMPITGPAPMPETGPAPMPETGPAPMPETGPVPMPAGPAAMPAGEPVPIGPEAPPQAPFPDAPPSD